MTRSIHAISVALLALLLLGGIAASARAELQFTSTGVSLTSVDGLFTRQAGSHPDLDIHFMLGSKEGALGEPVPNGTLRDVNVALPPGFVGNPTAAPTCKFSQLLTANGDSVCPIASQVGFAKVRTGPSASSDTGLDAEVYNMEHGPDVPALFAFVYVGNLTEIVPHVRPDDYGITAGSVATSEGLPVFQVDVELWGIPADPIHNAERSGLTNPEDVSSRVVGGPSTGPRKPFLTTPTSCSAAPLGYTISADSWEEPGNFVSSTLTADPDGTPFVSEGCDRLPFAPVMSVQPSSHRAGAPTGLDVDLSVPQSEAPDGLATSDVRRTAVMFPEGMSVSASSAAGLDACSLSGVGLGTNDEPACPEASKIGTVEIDTPLLETPLKGDVILAKQGDNPFHSLLALYIVADGPVFVLKLPGKIEPDPVTGRLTAVFDNTPQLPFSSLHLVLHGGSQAALVNPATCGTFTTHAEITPWSGTEAKSSDSSFTVDQGCDQAARFEPSFSAGTLTPSAGTKSSFVLGFSRPDGQQTLKAIDTVLPGGLLGLVGSVPLCPEAQAAAGTCSSASRIGSVQVASGAGATPVLIPEAGRAPTAVYLAGPYEGAPFSLSIVVPAQAGPFDLGTVVVRAALFVDPHDAHVSVRSDALPSILQGIPLDVRQVQVTVDRPGFILNPTSCAVKQISAAISSNQGAVANVASRFQAANCGELAFKPSLTASTKAKATRANGAALDVKVVEPAGREANIHSVRVELPKALPSRLTTLQKACVASVFDANPASCPAASVVGFAKAVTPVLGVPLAGPAYFVSHGGAAFPDLEVVLQGQGVTIMLTGTTFISRQGVTSSTFGTVPDAPITSFELSLPVGPHSALAANGSLCAKALRMPTRIVGQNGVQLSKQTTIKVSGCPKAKKKTPKAKAKEKK